MASSCADSAASRGAWLRTLSSVVTGALLLTSCTATSSGSSAAGEQDTGSDAASERETETETETGSDLEPELRVAVIGDSIGYGQGDCGGCTSFIDLYAAGIEESTGATVAAENLSTHDNLTSGQLVERIRTDDYYREAVARTDVLVVSIGHNDAPWAVADDTCDGPNGDEPRWSLYREPCMSQAARDQSRHLGRFLAEASALREGQPTVQVVTTVYNDWIGIDGVPAAATRPTTHTLDAFADAACRTARTAGAVCLDSYRAFNGPQGARPAGELLAPDTVHPSAAGHEVFAELLMQVDLGPVV